VLIHQGLSLSFHQIDDDLKKSNRVYPFVVLLLVMFETE
jgi:hypothetical protein